MIPGFYLSTAHASLFPYNSNQLKLSVERNLIKIHNSFLQPIYRTQTAFVNRSGIELLNSFTNARQTEGVRLNKTAICLNPTGIVCHLFHLLYLGLYKNTGSERFVQEYRV